MLGCPGRSDCRVFRVLLFLALLHEALAHSRNGQLVGLFGPLLLAEINWKVVDFHPAAARRPTAERCGTWSR